MTILKNIPIEWGSDFIMTIKINQTESPIPNEETIKAIENIRNGIGISRSFTSVEELMESLDADNDE